MKRARKVPLDRRIVDQTTDKAMREHREAIAGLLSHPLFDGALVPVDLTATVDTPVQHGLGRRARGYIVTQRSDNVHVYDGTPPAGATQRDDVIWLVANSDVSVTLWIF